MSEEYHPPVSEAFMAGNAPGELLLVGTFRPVHLVYRSTHLTTSEPMRAPLVYQPGPPIAVTDTIRTHSFRLARVHGRPGHVVQVAPPEPVEWLPGWRWVSEDMKRQWHGVR